MALIDKARWPLLSVLTIAALASCGPQGRKPEQPAQPSAPYKETTVPDLSPPKGGDPVGALPSLVVAGEVAAFKAMPANAGIQKSLDTAGSLPSNVAAGKSAVYAPGAAQEPSAPGTPPAMMAKP